MTVVEVILIALTLASAASAGRLAGRGVPNSARGGLDRPRLSSRPAKDQHRPGAALTQ
jgi:hypothetical protein